MWDYSDIKLSTRQDSQEYPSQEVVHKLTSLQFPGGTTLLYEQSSHVLLDWLRRVDNETDENEDKLDHDIDAERANRPDLPVNPKFDCYDFRYRLPAPNLGIYDLIPPLTITSPLLCTE